MTPDMPLPEADLVAIERAAVELATLAGARIRTALGRSLAIRYKPGADGDGESLRDPVSEVDHDVEVLIRERVAQLFPGHDVIGEEIDERPGADHDIVWVVDPIDGTANFINGYPLFSASIGVLHRGVPVAGAVWCSTSHALRAGVYHARRGGRLAFESETFEPSLNPGLRRRIVGLGPDVAIAGLPCDIRRSGSSAVECAFVAAGLMGGARFETPNVWDVAGGIPLVEAAGGAVRVDTGSGWEPFGDFGHGPDLPLWRGRVAIGGPEIVDLLCADRS
jgi:myo-inositol-1(or 4)-monophosphatase